MKQWRISFEGIDESDRPRLTTQFLERFKLALDRHFLLTLGFHYSGITSAGSIPAFGPPPLASWDYTRGRFQGIQIAVLKEGSPLRSLKVTADDYRPWFKCWGDRIERWNDAAGEYVRAHLVFPVLILLALALSPLLALFTLARLVLQSNLVMAGEILEAAWHEVDSRPDPARFIKRLMSQPAALFLALVLACSAAAGCFWWARLGPPEAMLTVVLQMFGGILAFVALILLIACIMTTLGLEMRR